jgi:uncharacterized protein (TIGR02266 family)
MSDDYTRASARAKLEVPVDFDLADMTCTGVTRNISVGGVFIATENLPRVGDRINLRFALPGNGRRLTIQTEVRWVRGEVQAIDEHRPSGVGLRFLNPSAEDVAALEQFLSRRDRLMGQDD